MIHPDLLYRLDISTFCFYESLLFLDNHKHLALTLSSITFTASSQADNHFYKYIILFEILLSSDYKTFYIQICFKCENVLQKQLFIEKNIFFL